MDIWVVAAAAGAGYVAQHCKNLIKSMQSLPNSSCGTPTFVRPASAPIRQQVQDKNCSPFDTVYGKNPGLEVCSGRERGLQDASVAEMASTSRFDDEDGRANCTTCSDSKLLPGLLSNEDVQGNQEGVRVGINVDEMNGDLFQTSTQEMGVSYGFVRKKSSLRSRGIKIIKPLSSLESCIMAQLYKEQAEIEDYAFSSTGSPRPPIVRPFIVTDGNRIISRATGDSFSLPNVAVQNKTYTNTCLQEKRTIFGVPQLPKVGSKEFRRKPNTKTRMEQGGKLSYCSKTENWKHQLLPGLSQGPILFCLGISIGIISSFLSNKQEVDRLNKMLKQAENLVQDLHEELEMKDSLTVKELAVEDYESQDTQNKAFNNGPQREFPPEEKQDTYHDENYDRNAEEESFNKIEAELEAELERLELSMNSSSLEGKLSNLVELGADYEPTVVEGELEVDVLCRQGDPQPYSDRDGSGSSTTHSANYAVSPRELSLRLHEVIQSRLEHRVEELETALQNSQKKVQYMETQHTSYWREFSNSESGSSSIQGSPVLKHQNHADQPVVINLSGDALDAYNEVYDEFTRMNELEEEDTPCGVKDNLKEESLQTFDQNTCLSHNGGLNDNTHRKSFTDKRLKQKGRDNSTLLNDILTSRDHSDGDPDEMEELLIKHIVEKARKGSPVVLNAQRALFSPDENEH